MTITRYTPEEWREAYGNLIAENGEKLPQRKMAEALRISRTTLQHYLNDPKYRLQEKEVVQKVAQVAQKKVNHSEDMSCRYRDKTGVHKHNGRPNSEFNCESDTRSSTIYTYTLKGYE